MNSIIVRVHNSGSFFVVSARDFAPVLSRGVSIIMGCLQGDT